MCLLIIADLILTGSRSDSIVVGRANRKMKMMLCASTPFPLSLGKIPIGDRFVVYRASDGDGEGESVTALSDVEGDAKSEKSDNEGYCRFVFFMMIH